MRKTSFLWIGIGITAVILYGALDPALYPFPSCPFRSLTGFLCPGCGSQRAIHQLLHGHIMSSFKLNQLFIPVVLYGIAGALVLFLLPKKWPEVREKWYGKRAGYISLVIILVYWIGRNVI